MLSPAENELLTRTGAGAPMGHTFVVKSLIENNYLQSLEGEVDSAHTAYLHRTFGAPGLTQQDGAHGARAAQP